MPTWEEMRPVLVAAYRAMDSTPDGGLEGSELATACGRDNDDPMWYRDMQMLNEAGYLDVHFGGAMTVAYIRGTEKGRQEVQGWPGPRTDRGAAELLLALLEARANDEQANDDERKKAGALRDAVRGVGTDFFAKIVSELAYRGTGLG